MFAEGYYNKWNTLKKGGVLIDIVANGLALVIRPLIAYYRDQKKLFEQKSPRIPYPHRDYDIIRECGINPRDILGSQSMAPISSELAAVLDCLEAVAPGLLILLRPDFFQIAFNTEYTDSCLPSNSKLLNIPSFEEEGRKEFVTNLYAHGTHSVAYKECSEELFKILCGEDNSAWKVPHSKRSKCFRMLYANTADMLDYTKMRDLNLGEYTASLVARDKRTDSFGWRYVRRSKFEHLVPHTYTGDSLPASDSITAMTFDSDGTMSDDPSEE